MAARTPEKAIAWGRARIGERGWDRLCLSFVRQCYGIDYPPGWDTRPGYADRNAGTAWDRAKHKHRTSDPLDIPRGVPVFFETPGEADHIVLSLGQGRCLSNDFVRAGRIDECMIADIARKWGPLQGWAEDLLGTRVYTEVQQVPIPPAKPTGLRVHGVDISHHQSGLLDMNAAKKAGVLWVYHKATEGATYRDPKFDRRRDQAKKAGLPFGAYHFARPSRTKGDATKEALFFLSVAKPQPGDMIPVLDIEVTDGLTSEQVQAWVSEFSDVIKDRIGVRPVLYTQSSWDLGESEKNHLLWRARYNNDNRPPARRWDIHQFSNGTLGRPNTIAGFGHVDLNTMREGLTLKQVLIPVKVETHRLRIMNCPLQFSDTRAQKQADVEKIFARAKTRGVCWLTGTEAGELPLSKILSDVASQHGYRVHRDRGNWVAVRTDAIKQGSWKTGVVFVEDTENVEGVGHDSTFPWVTFEHAQPGVGVVSVAAVHYPRKGRVPGDPNYQVNRAYAAKLDLWGREKAKGRALAFVGGDFNMPDRQLDVFFSGDFTTFGDELQSWPDTGYGPIDAMATWNGDGRVRVLSYRALTDKAFFLNGDHFASEGAVEVELLPGRVVSAEVLAFAVPAGWEWCDIIRQVGREEFRLHYYPDNSVRFEHRCDRGDRGVIICAPALSPGHVLTRNAAANHANPQGKPTVSPSILCPDCGTHGFIVDGWWRAA